MTLPVFDTPQFPLMPDKSGRRMYGNVDNLMEVVRNGQSVYVLLAVPTGLFTLMQDVLRVPPEEHVCLSLDEGEDGRYIFSLMYGTNLVDLWTYSQKSKPAWTTMKEYFVSQNTLMLRPLGDN